MDSRLISVVAMVMLWVPVSAQNLTAISVGNLTTQITREECARTQRCITFPMGCDPAINGSCLFVSTQTARTQRNIEVAFELRGSSDGYIAVGLSTDSTAGGNDTMYICANNVSNVIFQTALLDNGNVAVSNASVTNVLGSVSANVIQCTFTAEGLNATGPRGPSTSFVVFLANGSFTNGQPGRPSILLTTSQPVDLTMPGNGITNSTNATPTTSTTPTTDTSNALQYISHGMLILIAVLLLCL